MKRLILLFTLVLVTCLSYSKPKKPIIPALLDGNYTLVRQKTKGAMQMVNIEKADVTFFKTNKKINIDLGCNKISGKFTIGNGNRFHAFQMVSTKMGCPDQIEADFLQNIARANLYRINGSQVEFYTNKTLLFVLLNKQDIQTNSLSPEGRYKLESVLIDGKLVTGKYPKSSVNFSQGRIQCNVGCNSIGGEFVTKGNKIQPLKLMMTEMYCEDVASLEQQFVDHLNNIDSFEIKADKLYFYTKGKLVMVLVMMQS